MKKTIVLAGAAFLMIAFMSFDILSDKGKAGYTGSPGEATCNTNGCHNSFVLNSGGGSVVITAPTLTGWQYTPGQTYPISVTVSKTGVPLFGFAFEALTSAGANAGTLIVTSSHTNIKVANIGGNLRNSMTHTKNGGLANDSYTFDFQWTAPNTNIGDITFYAAGNATNKNALVSGDYIYTLSQVVTAPAVGVKENPKNNIELSLYPNPAKESTTISYELMKNEKVSASLISLSGQLISTFFDEEQSAGKKEKKLIIDPSLSKGVYLLVLSIDGSKSYKKLIIE